MAKQNEWNLPTFLGRYYKKEQTNELLRKMREETAEAKNEVVDAEKRMMQLRDEREERLEALRAESEARIRELEQEIARYREAKLQAEEDLERADRTIGKMQKALSDAQTETEGLQTKLALVQRASEQKENRLAIQQETIERLRKENDELVDENAGLSRQLSEQADEAARRQSQTLYAEGANERLQKKIRWTEERVCALEQELKAYAEVYDENKLAQADEQARQIVELARKQSGQITRDAQDLSVRAYSTIRSIFHKTVEFKASLMQCFADMESDIDECVDVLRTLENASLSLPPNALDGQENPAKDGDAAGDRLPGQTE